MHLVSDSNSKDIPRLTTTQGVPLIPGGDLLVEFRYRSDIESSGMHGGSWVYLQFFDADGKVVKAESDGLAIPKSGAWNGFKGRMKVPPGATLAQAQIRIQQTHDKFLDIDDLKMGCSPPPAAVSADPLHNPDLVTLASFVLQPDSTLKGSDGETLKNLSQPGVTPSFQLPEKYCERPEFSYGIAATFTADVDKLGSESFPTVFSLGSVFSGGDSNSMEAAFLGPNSLMFRVRCARNSGGMQWAFPVDCAQGKTAVAAALLGRNELQAYAGLQWKRITSPTPFTWEKDRTFRLGKLGGAVKVQSFTLTVFKPGVIAALEEGKDTGLFHGAGPHQWGILFPDGNGQKATLDFKITDFFGKTYPVPKITATADNTIRFSLPQLPYGWYNLKVKAGVGGYVRTIERAFAVTPELDLSIPADESPLGITQEFTLRKDSFSPAGVEQMFSACAAAGNRWFRLWTEWDYFQQEPGMRDWSRMDQVAELAQKYHIELYINLAGGNLPWQTSHEPGTPRPTCYLSQYLPRNLDQWSEFVTDFAGRYRGKISYFQVGNECDTKEFFQPFSPESYLKYLKAGYLAVKKGNPDAKVGTCGFAYAFGDFDSKMKPGDRVFSARDFWDLKPEPYYDIIDCHYYSSGTPNFYWDNFIPIVRRFWDFLKLRGEDKKPMWNSETGFQSGVKGEHGGYDPTNPMISDYEQACRIVEWHMQSQSVNITRSFNYIVAGTSGLFQGDFSPKVSYASSVNLSRMLPGMKFERELPLVSDMFGYSFSGKKTGRHMICVWCRSGRFPLAIIAAPDAAVTKIDLFGNQSKLQAVNGVSMVMTDESPVYFVSERPFDAVNFITATTLLSGEPGKIKMRVNVINPTLKPMQIALGVGFPETEAVRREFTVPSGERQEFVLMVPQGKGNPTMEVQVAGAADANFSMAVPYTARPQVELPSSGSAEFKIDRQEQVKIGSLEMDTQNRVLSPSKWRGPADSSASVKLTRDGDKVSFKIQVTDDQVVTTPDHQPYDQDCVEFFYGLFDDAGKVTERGQTVVRADGKVVPFSKLLLPDFQVKSEQNAQGYHLTGSFTLPEAAIKQHAMLFDVAIDDADTGDHGRRTQIFWAWTADNHTNAENHGAIILP